MKPKNIIYLSINSRISMGSPVNTTIYNNEAEQPDGMIFPDKTIDEIE